jgi:formylglycine-generating enzyme required for sulfatase activity
VFHDSRQWCFLSIKPGTDPLKALVASFLDTWQFPATDFERIKQQNGLFELLRDGKASLSDLIDATERRRNELDQPKPPGIFLYVDQGEELYVRAEEGQRRRFSELLAHSLTDVRLRVMMSLRSDFLGHLQNDEPLFKARHQIDVAPLHQTELREIVSRPAQLLGARFETEELVDIISRRTAEDSAKDVGALPLLSYTLDDMWTYMVRRGDGTLRLPAQSFELGAVLVDRANRFLATHPGAEPALRRILTLRCATVREEGEPTRRRAARAEFSPEEWRLISELADFPNRLLVTATTEAGDTYAEVAHEAIFRRWDKLREWIAAEREFLVWRSAIEAARRTWQATPDNLKNDALLMGLALEQAQRWLANRADDIPTDDRQFIELSRNISKRRRRRMQALIGGLALPILLIVVLVIASVVYFLWHDITVVRPYVAGKVGPYVLGAAAEQRLMRGATFRECATEQSRDFCPEMVVVPAGSFMMGSEKSHDSLKPQHRVTITKRFAVSKYEVTFDEWDTCVTYGNCGQVNDSAFGRGQRPVINVSWDGAQRYIAWLSKITGKPYRLLTEAEYEYATRAGTQTEYPWGDEIGRNNANCKGCGSEWDGREPAPVGSFAANAFGLYDMVGNVFAWVEDCYHPNYEGAPTDGTAWIAGCADVRRRVIRGSSWFYGSEFLVSAFRYWGASDTWGNTVGFRVARTLSDEQGQSRSSIGH